MRLLRLLVVSSLLHAQTDAISERVKEALGDAGETDLRARNFSRLEEKLASLKPSDENQRAELLALQGAIAFLDGHMADAVKDFRDSEKIHTAKEADRFTLAMALVKLDDEEAARGVLSRLSNEHPNSAIYWYWLGRLDYFQRRYTEAVEKLGTAVKLDPKAARAWDSLGLAWDMQGHLEQAREMFEKAVSLNREQAHPSPWPPHNFGYLLLRLGETAKAEEELRESLRYDGKMAQTHYYLGRTLEKEDRAEEAVAEYQMALTNDTTSAEICYSLATLYRKMHREVEATAMFAEYKRRKSRQTAPNP